MQITINEAEIKDAIRNHMLAQISVNSDSEINIDLRATRGDAGYTAVIDITPKHPGSGSGSSGGNDAKAPTKSSDAKGSAASAPKASVQQEKTAEPAEPTKADNDAAEVQADTDTEAKPEKVINFGRKADDAPPPPAEGQPRSIFASMTKPNNRTAEGHGG